MLPTLRTLFILIAVTLATGITAQKAELLREVRTYLDQTAPEKGWQPTDLAELTLTDYYQDEVSGLRHVYVQQHHNGIEIEGAIAGYHTNAAGEPIHYTSRFAKKLTGRVKGTQARLDAEAAVLAAARALELPFDRAPTLLKSSGAGNRQSTLSPGDLSLEDIPARLVYQTDDQGFLRLAWRVEIYTPDAQHYYVARVDAGSGKLLAVEDLVISCAFDHAASAPEDCDHAHGTSVQRPNKTNFQPVTSVSTTSSGNYYRVYDVPVETPNHGDRSLVVTNGDPVASPFGWHNDGTLSYPVTRGNNVYAYYDGSGGNAGEPAVGGLNPGQPLNFDFPLDLSQQPVTYKDAAITNLFYWNNKVHDIFYHYGFTEEAGNFQQDNRGRGGLAGDGVMAEAQDGGGTNNANFLTLPDGAPGRMQMYLWSSNAPAELVHVENSATYPNGGPGFSSLQAAFGADVTENGLTGDLVLIEANDLSASECSSCGCGTGQGVGLAPSNDVSGKIALIDRGDCSFIEKVMGAQAGGAIGVIVANNIPGAGPISMGGDETGNAIVIPAVMISFEHGALLKDELSAGAVSVSLRRDEPLSPMKDGDLDNGIIVHEYGHGISTRLTGGPNTTCLSGDEQAGEGWSDFFALMTTYDAAGIADAGQVGRGIGTYVFDEPTDGNGIRPARYSRDLAVNPYTYGDLNNAEISVPHGIGFIFCTALHDMTWNLIDQYGYNPDLVNGSLSDGNILALQLVMDGLKLQPCSPTFLESRDAILAADQALTGGANACLIWEAFAKRGMGVSAQSGTNSRGDEVAAFDLPAGCTPVVSAKMTTDSYLVENGNEIEYNITVTNSGDVAAKGVRMSNPLSSELSYVSGSGGSFKSSTGTVTFAPFDLDAGATRNLSFRAVVNTPDATELNFFDDMEDGINSWNPNLGLNQWQHTAGAGRSGEFSWFAADPDNASEQVLTQAQPILLSSGAVLSFNHRYHTEAGFDGGVVELSNDGGVTWYDLGNQMTQGGYTDFIPVANNALIGGFAFGGNSNGWMRTEVDLGLFGGQSVLIRFRFASDVLTGAEGWYVDDVVVADNVTEVTNTVEYKGRAGLKGDASTANLVVPASALPKSLTNEFAASDLPTTLFPNPARDRVAVRLNDLEEGELSLTLLDLNGRELQRRNITVTAGVRTENIMVADLPAGVYLLQVLNGGKQETLRLNVQR